MDKLRQLLSRGGFRLMKWISSSKQAIESFPEEERAKDVKDLMHPLPNGRALFKIAYELKLLVFED